MSSNAAPAPAPSSSHFYNDRPDPTIKKEYDDGGYPQMSLEMLPKELKGHEVRYFGRIPVYITTLPAGTLLFRGLNHLGSLRDDFLGYRSTLYDKMNIDELLKEYDKRGMKHPFYKNEDEKNELVLSQVRLPLVTDDINNGREPPYTEDRVLKNTFNVFFYPFPIIDSAVAKFPTTVIYVVQKDVKIASFISPSPYTRGIRTSNSFVTTCRDVDPCFTTAFIKRNPDVVGMIAIYVPDQKVPIVGNEKYITLYTDIRPVTGSSFPEIILYPRSSYTNTTTMETKDLAEIVKTIPDLTYLPYHIVEHRSEQKLKDIIDTGLSGKSLTELLGFEDELFIDKATGFYISKKYYTGDASRLVKDRLALKLGDGIFYFPSELRSPYSPLMYSEDNEDYDYLNVIPGWTKKWKKTTNQPMYIEDARPSNVVYQPPLPPGWRYIYDDLGRRLYRSPNGKVYNSFPYQLGGHRRTIRRKR